MANDKTIAQCQICKGDINVGETHQCPKESWEKDFDELYHNGVPMGNGIFMENPYLGYSKEQTKSFIRQLLEQEEANWMAEIHELLEAQKAEYTKNVENLFSYDVLGHKVNPKKGTIEKKLVLDFILTLK